VSGDSTWLVSGDSVNESISVSCLNMLVIGWIPFPSIRNYLYKVVVLVV